MSGKGKDSGGNTATNVPKKSVTLRLLATLFTKTGPGKFPGTGAAKYDYELQFTPGSGVGSSKRGSSTGNKTIVNLTATEAGGLNRIVIWGVPYGAYGLRFASDPLLVGRIDGPPPKPIAGEMVFPFEVGCGVAAYMMQECNTNSISADVADIKRLISDSDAHEARADSLSSSGNWIDKTKNFPESLQESVESKNSYRLALQKWYDLVQTGHKWDHKPIIDPVWGAYHRLGVHSGKGSASPLDLTKGTNRPDTIPYDVWSNFHFGFVGHACGFSLAVLLEGSDVAQRFSNLGKGKMPSGDPARDIATITDGFSAYSPSKTLTVDDLAKFADKYAGQKL